MGWLPIIIALIAGFALGLGVAFILRFFQAKTAKELANELFSESEAQRKADIDTVIENVKTSFGNLWLEALSKSTEEFLKLAKTRLETERETGIKELDAKKSLIDQQLQRMTSELENVSKLMKELEKDRAEKFGELAEQLKKSPKFYSDGIFNYRLKPDGFVARIWKEDAKTPISIYEPNKQGHRLLPHKNQKKLA